jgi:hypothetical protein
LIFNDGLVGKARKSRFWSFNELLEVFRLIYQFKISLGSFFYQLFTLVLAWKKSATKGIYFLEFYKASKDWGRKDNLI